MACELLHEDDELELKELGSGNIGDELGWAVSTEGDPEYERLRFTLVLCSTYDVNG